MNIQRLPHLATMLGLMTAFGLAGSTPALAQNKPDLKILVTLYIGSGLYKVAVSNQGSAWSAPCKLGIQKGIGNYWINVTLRDVPAISPGDYRIIWITDPAVTMHPTRFKVDATNIVSESNESNNTRTP